MATGKKAASAAGRTLNSSGASKAEKSVAGSDLMQAARKAAVSAAFSKAGKSSGLFKTKR